MTTVLGELSVFGLKMSTGTNSQRRKSQLTGISLIVGGFLLWMFGCAGVTPASVFVSGYSRSNGTYVHSYSRRHADSVTHDAPFETAELLGFLSACAGIYSLITKRGPQTTSPTHYVDVRSPRKPAEEEIELFPMPTIQGTADSDWRCDSCSRPFGRRDALLA